VIVLGNKDQLSGAAPTCVFAGETGDAINVQCCESEGGEGVQCSVPLNANPRPAEMLLGSGDSVSLTAALDVQAQVNAGYPPKSPDTAGVLYFRYGKTCVVNGGTPTKTPNQGMTWHESTLSWLRGEGGLSNTPSSLAHKAMAEAVGTAMIVLFGCGSVCAAVLSGAQAGLWQVAAVWGFGVSIAIYSTASISGAHLNPAVSLAFALLRPASFTFTELGVYCLAQLLGAIVAGVINLTIFSGPLSAFESANGFERGDAASVLTAACFGEYFPNPGFQYSGVGPNKTLTVNAALGWTDDTITPFGACCIEAWGTTILVFVIFALTDDRNKALVRKEMAPFFIGFTVAVLISVYAPLTQAGWNPARDFGPRLVAFFAGWGNVAIPGPRNGFWVYIIGPFLGGIIGGSLYDFVFSRGYTVEEKKE